MFKSILALAVLLSAPFAHAELSGNCKNQIRLAYNNELVIRRDVAAGKLTKLEARDLLDGSHDLVVSAVALCVGLKMVELQRSVFGQLGLISQDYAKTVAKQTSDEAMSYYRFIKRRG